jgi:hypothetical protein
MALRREHPMDESKRGRVVGILPTTHALQAVVDRLEVAGFDHAQFGVLAPQAAARDWRSAEALARDPNVRTKAPRDPESLSAAKGGILGAGILVGALAVATGPILAGGGLAVALASTLGGGGAGALIGALVAHGFHRRHAEFVESQLSRGGIVLWILTRNVDEEEEAQEALRDAGATEVQVQASLKD